MTGGFMVWYEQAAAGTVEIWSNKGVTQVPLKTLIPRLHSSLISLTFSALHSAAPGCVSGNWSTVWTLWERGKEHALICQTFCITSHLFFRGLWEGLRLNIDIVQRLGQKVSSFKNPENIVYMCKREESGTDRNYYKIQHFNRKLFKCTIKL